jgi:hypothetical protein
LNRPDRLGIIFFLFKLNQGRNEVNKFLGIKMKVMNACQIAPAAAAHRMPRAMPRVIVDCSLSTDYSAV